MTIAENVKSGSTVAELIIPDSDEIRPRRPIPRDEIIEVEKWHQELHDLKRLALNRLRRLALKRAFDIGFKLRCWHDLIPHGKWLPWLRANVQIPERTASQYLLLWDHNEEIKATFKSADIPDSADLNELPPIKDALALIANKRAEKRPNPVAVQQVVHRIPAVKTPVQAHAPKSAADQATDHLEQTEADPNDETDADDQTKLSATQQQTDEMLVITRFSKFLRELSRVIQPEQYRPIFLKDAEYIFRLADESEDPEEDDNSFCEVG
jgi:hypothetical protein